MVLFGGRARSKSPHKLKISAPSNPTKGGQPLERLDKVGDAEHAMHEQRTVPPLPQTLLAAPDLLAPVDSAITQATYTRKPLTRSTSFADFLKHGFSSFQSDQPAINDLPAFIPEDTTHDITNPKKNRSKSQPLVASSDQPAKPYSLLSNWKKVITDRLPGHTRHRRASSLNSATIFSQVTKGKAKSARNASPTRPGVTEPKVKLLTQTEIDHTAQLKFEQAKEEIERRIEQGQRVQSSPKLSRHLRETPELIQPGTPNSNLKTDLGETRSDRKDSKFDSSIRHTKSFDSRTVLNKDLYADWLRQTTAKFDEHPSPLGLGLDLEQTAPRLVPHRPDSAFLAFDFDQHRMYEDNGESSSAMPPRVPAVAPASAPPPMPTSGPSSGPASEQAPVSKFVSQYTNSVSGLFQHSDVFTFAEPPAHFKKELQMKLQKEGVIPTPPPFKATEPPDVQWQPEHFGKPMQHSPFDDAANGVQRQYTIPTVPIITYNRASDGSKRDSVEAGTSTGSPKLKKKWKSQDALNNWEDVLAAQDANVQGRTGRSTSLGRENMPVMPSLRDASFSTLLVERGDSPERPPVPNINTARQRLARARKMKRMSLQTSPTVLPPSMRIEPASAMPNQGLRMKTGDMNLSDVPGEDGKRNTRDSEYFAQIGKAITTQEDPEWEEGTPGTTEEELFDYDYDYEGDWSNESGDGHDEVGRAM